MVLRLLECDIFPVMRAVPAGTLSKTEVKFKNASAACVIMASSGYPQKYESGFELEIDPAVESSVYVAGAKRSGDKLLTAGGRVLGVTAVEPTLEGAIAAAYEKVKKISFKNAHYRKDIGTRALKAREGK